MWDFWISGAWLDALKVAGIILAYCVGFAFLYDLCVRCAERRESRDAVDPAMDLWLARARHVDASRSRTDVAPVHPLRTRESGLADRRAAR
jgi:hypothetical protein